MTTTPSPRPITLLICALGGEGGGVLTEWLVDVARLAGYAAQSTSIPGVAQRTGATTYYLEVFPVPLAELAQLAGKTPIFSLNPVPGALDGLVSSELLETARQGSLGLPSPDRTLVISSTARTLTTQERIALGDGRADNDALVAVIQSVSRQHHLLDMAGMAQSAGTIVSAVMLGAVAGSGLLPFARADYEAVIQAGGKASAASLRGFASGWAAVNEKMSDSLPLTLSNNELKNDTVTASNGLNNDLNFSENLPSFLADFPAAVHPLATLGHARMLEYQGPAYAALYIARLRQVLAAEQAIDPAGTHAHAITTDMARWLALWMAFDDIVRVADLKSRSSRFARVAGEVKAGAHDMVKVYDHFKPGVPEVAGLLPTALATRLLAWDRKRALAGKAPWAMPLKIGSHTVLGMLALRTLALCKPLRALGSRYATEQALIERWLASVVRTTGLDWALGFEVAQCGRLIKGYGSTNERGKDNLLHIIDHLAQQNSPVTERTAAVAAARAAALADDAGQALDRTLVQHGAPARPVKEHPVRFVRKPKQTV